VDEDGNAITDYKGNQTVTLGLKSIAKEKAKQQANSYIARFNWLVERSIYDSSKTIPSAVGTYVGNIKTDCAAIEAAIDAASDMTAFKTLYENTYNSDGTINVVARINRWSDDYDVKSMLDRIKDFYKKFKKDYLVNFVSVITNEVFSNRFMFNFNFL
jgi:hypothetical protein